jgi:GNAT superfamily N-acetyltransferase
MLFASTSLAARIEHAERQLLEDCAAAIARRHGGSGVWVLPIAGGVATYTGPGSPLNKVAGLGFEASVDVAELERIEHEFGRRETPVQVELSCLADPSVGELLTRRGYTLRGFENVLGRALPVEGSVSPTPGVTISESPAGELANWLDVVVSGFATPDDQGVRPHESFTRDALERAIGDMAAADGFVRYLARLEGRPAGGASMRLCDGIAQLCGASTVPAIRRRGVQSALLATRLERASDAGCDIAVVTTQPGSKSQQNVQRRGFELLYTRAVLVREV